jgi:hypothetical protein
MTTNNLPHLMVLFFSNYSDHCKNLRDHIKDEYLSFFKPLCIDSEEVRNIILQSNNIKIDKVPCLLNIFADGTVAKYEADKAFQWIQNFIASRNQVNLDNIPLSSVDKLLGNSFKTQPKYSRVAKEENYEEGHNKLIGLQSRKPSQIHIPEVYPDVPQRKNTRNEYVDSTFRPLISSINMQQQNRDQVLERDNHPMRRNEYMLQRDDVEENEDYSETFIRPENNNLHMGKQVTFGSGKNAKIIEDITPDEVEMEDTFIDDPSGMSIPRTETIINKQSGGIQPLPINVPKKSKINEEKGTAIKTLAKAIASSREADEKIIEERKQGPISNQRQEAKRTKISL